MLIIELQMLKQHHISRLIQSHISVTNVKIEKNTENQLKTRLPNNNMVIISSNKLFGNRVTSRWGNLEVRQYLHNSFFIILLCNPQKSICSVFSIVACLFLAKTVKIFKEQKRDINGVQYFL